MAVINTTLRINMTGHSADAEQESARYQAALDMAEYADRHDFALVNLEEHHCAQIGWLPAPLILAGAVASRTRRIRIRVCALLVTLYDPIRLAENLAVLDLVSRGRVLCVLGQGYRPLEFHALDKDWQRRGENTDFIIETLLKAWSGESFDYRGQRIRVTPMPYSRPHPPLWYGGMSRAAARRAARFGLPFYPPAPMPELEAEYRAELQRLGKSGHTESPGPEASLLFIDENPERAWEEIGPYLLREAQEYSSWRREGVERPYEADSSMQQETLTLQQLRAQKRYEIITPQECRQRVRAAGDHYNPILHPLCGGIPIERAWRSLELYVERVLKPERG